MADQSQLQRLWMSWVNRLTGFKSRLPNSLQQRLAGLSNGALTGILLGVVLLFGWGLLTLVSPRPVPTVVDAAADAPTQTQTNFEVTPDPALIADIQDQVATISQQFSTEVLQSVQPDFRQSCLIISLGLQWYDLSNRRQDQLANELWQRTQDLSFEKLELRDSTLNSNTDNEQSLIARNPVVGDEMVILKRLIDYRSEFQ